MWRKSKYLYTVITGPLLKCCMIPSFCSTDQHLWTPSTSSTWNQTIQLPTWCSETRAPWLAPWSSHPDPLTHKLKVQLLIWPWTRLQESRIRLLLNLIFYCIDSLSLWILKFVGGASKVTQDVVASVMQEDIFNLKNIPQPPIPRYYSVMHLKIWFIVI